MRSDGWIARASALVHMEYITHSPANPRHRLRQPPPPSRRDKGWMRTVYIVPASARLVGVKITRARSGEPSALTTI